MLAKRIIPCLDIKDNRVVKGEQFLNLRDAGDPVEVAINYDKENADELVFLDITASHERRDTLIDLVRRIAENIFIPFTVGGGIRTAENIRNILKAGADKVSINSAAVLEPELISRGAEIFGSQCIVIAIDAKRRGSNWEVYINGGRKPTGIDAVEWAEKAVSLGAGEILLTSMDRDGTKSGYDNELNKAISDSVNVPVIASGGAGSVKDMADAFIYGHVSAVLAASIFHYKMKSIMQVKKELKAYNIPIRL